MNMKGAPTAYLGHLSSAVRSLVSIESVHSWWEFKDL